MNSLEIDVIIYIALPVKLTYNKESIANQRKWLWYSLNSAKNTGWKRTNSMGKHFCQWYLRQGPDLQNI